MRRFQIVKAKTATFRRTQAFVLALILVLVFGVIYRGRQAATRLTQLLSENFEEHPNQLTQEHFPQTQPLLANLSHRHEQNVSLTDERERQPDAQNVSHTGERERQPDVQILSLTDEKVRQDSATQHGRDSTDSPDEILDDPCTGRTQPVPIPADASKPPSLYFLHIPKTAGTLIHHLVIRYALKTRGLPCQYLYDGNRFEPCDFHLSVKPPPQFPNGSIEQQAVDAVTSKNRTLKLQLLTNGACRGMRGHVTYKQRDFMPQPIISLTVVRDPLERLFSMYEFAMMMIRARPGKSGWDHLITGDFEADFANSSSLLHQGFYDKNGKWLAKNNTGFSFHFYGVLHQLSGITPVFEGVGVPEQFRIANADQLAEKAKDNICSTHILGTQSDMSATLDLFFRTVTPYSNWTDAEIKGAKSILMNKNVRKKNATEENWSDTLRTAMRKRFQHELDVHDFALKVIRYRKQLAEHQ